MVNLQRIPVAYPGKPADGGDRRRFADKPVEPQRRDASNPVYLPLLCLSPPTPWLNIYTRHSREFELHFVQVIAFPLLIN